MGKVGLGQRAVFNHSIPKITFLCREAIHPAMDKASAAKVRTADTGIAEIHILQNRVPKAGTVELHIPKGQPHNSAVGEIRLLSSRSINPQGMLGVEDSKVIRCQGFQFPMGFPPPFPRCS